MPRKRKAGKKRFRRAARSAGGRVRRAYRSYRSRRATRGRTLGTVGKTGVAIAAGAPIGVSAVEAADQAVGAMRSQQVGVVGTVKVGFWSFLNNLSTGFGMGPLVLTVPATNTAGNRISVPVPTSVPAGVWFKTSIIGGTLLAWDLAVSWTTRKLAKVNSGIRFLGTKLTGGK